MPGGKGVKNVDDRTAAQQQRQKISKHLNCGCKCCLLVNSSSIQIQQPSPYIMLILPVTTNLQIQKRRLQRARLS